MAETRYVVLELDDGVVGNVWHEVGRYAAHSADSAIRKANLKDGAEAVAVPERSWQPVTVQVDTKTVVTLKPASSPLVEPEVTATT